MASTRTGQNHLTDDDLRELSELKAAGKRATVYLREPITGLGLEEGASARVVSIDGSSIIVKPTGVNDEIPFEAHELRRTREAPQPAKRAPRKKAAPKVGSEAGSGRAGPGTAVAAAVPTRGTEPRAGDSRAEPLATDSRAVDSPPKTSPRSPAKKRPADASAGSPAPSPRSGAPSSTAGSAGGSKPRGKSAECAITLRADEEGSWSIEVDRPGGLSLKRSSITPDAVLRAIQQLEHPGALRAAQAALNAARKAAEQRVAELRKELAEAESALESLKAD
ncbi:translation initiation factor [Hoyosella sp. G463]|uniref:Translation initiation factor n=1 Tax=Lolliginicoccus lacisalsi TaxID=2742202 RepID=A0A927JF74_9ACTN|nr:translation initiation factor [Lolliginicoccus lacisalsi]MBD8507887.1 translation initiation factor [Lolliginicoccus lacisalsi]